MNARLLLDAAALAGALLIAVPVAVRMLALRDAWVSRKLIQKRYSVLESIPDAFFIIDSQMCFTHVNERAEALLCRGASELVGTCVIDVLDPLASELVPDMRRAQALEAPVERLQYFASTNMWIEIRIQPAADELLVYLRDVTKDKNAELQLSANERRFRVLLSQVPAVIWTVDLDMRVTSIAGAARNERGLFEERLLGEPFEALLGEYEEKETCAAAVARAFRGETVRYETRHGDRWMQNDVEPLRDPQGDIVGAIGVMLDVTEMRENADRFSKLARQDSLTGLPNRMALGERLPAMIDDANECGESLAVLFVDVDRFKTINDTLGHRSGDELLKGIANRLSGLLDARSMIFRPGGDEFVVVVGGIDQKHNVALLAANLINAFGEPFSIAGRDLFVSASVGGSMYPQDGQTAEELIAFADSAMYRSKEAGGNTARLYDGSAQTHVLERLGLEQDLRYALGRNELHLLYQPIVDMNSRRIIAAEALLRWQHPMLGELLPQIFIPIAEEAGIITELSRWVMREACRTAARIRSTVAPDFRVAVNLSPKDLYDVDFVAMLSSLLNETGLQPEALDVEITESVMVNEVAIATLVRMSRMGVGIVVDDFGTGYSSLGYIKRLPVNAVKIDKGFIDDVIIDRYDQGIVKTICTLGQTLGLRVIAEGIESEEQYDFVRSLQCRQAQGFFFSRPIPNSTLTELLRKSVARPSTGLRVVSLHA